MSRVVDLSDPGSSVDADDYLTSRTIAEALTAAYPGYLWAVHAQRRQGVARIRSMMLPANFGWTLHLHPTATASELTRKAVAGAGEILERYRMRRGAIDWDAYDAAPRDGTGLMIGDLT